MQHTFLLYVSLILIILLLVMLAQKLKIAYPIVLVIGGLLVSMVPVMRTITINPAIVFIIFLPPLLYEAAWNTSWRDLWKWRRVISSFAFLIVIVTSFVIALVSSAIIPGFTMAMGFLLGAIVSPPDAVSATSVLKYVKVPKRLSAIIEGESLLNDASSLIVFRFALVAVDTGRFVFHEAAVNFFLVIAMGILIGVAVAYIYFLVHKYLPTTPNIDIVLTLTAPYAMYIAAESFHFSGVLAVVSGALFLSRRHHLFLSYRSRLRGNNVWSTLGFVLNGLVFMLIGLEMPDIVKQLGSEGLTSAIMYGLMISVVLIVTRLLCTLAASPFTMFMSRFITTADSNPGWRGPLIFGWAGMRGVVSLAAALSIPIYLTNGTAFPQRNLILFITFMVILVTLVLQGLTLPWVIKKVNMDDPDKELNPAQQEMIVVDGLASESLRFLENHRELELTNKGLQQLRARFENDGIRDDEEHHSQADYLAVHYSLLDRQREFLHELDRKKEVSEEILRKFQGLIDLEEEKLRVRSGMEE